MKLRTVATAVALAAVLGATGCAASYEERMRHLDEVSAKGIAYRGQLYEQDTEPSREACTIGYDLLKNTPPYDRDGPDSISKAWSDQVKEAYIKSCMTGELKPKPDVDGVDAVTSVPITAPPDPVATSPTP
ncbi:hypothetical protein [Salinispora pacifica]|uniref:hypothetical protein n=1 Tax=Salinispora pacifica TaxID=351187 RepID=UPI0012F8CD78|nr:hypothetical protein [Salinispora pacifica]